MIDRVLVYFSALLSVRGLQRCTSGSAQDTACATYDSFDTHLLTATNAKNQVTTYEYDADAAEAGFGQWQMAKTDANGQTTTYEYDALGRLTAIINPGDSLSSPTITYTYTNTCSAGKTTPCLEIITSARFTAGGSLSTMKQWYDGWGHLVETQVPGPNLFSRIPAIPSVIVTYSIYSNMGQLTTKSVAYAVAATAGLGYVAPDLNQPRTVTGYDSLGRTRGAVTYSNATTIAQESNTSYTVAQGVPTLSSESSNAYEQKITLDAYNHQSITYTDGFGRARYSQVFSGTSSPYSVIRTVGTTYDTVGNTLSVITYNSAGTAQATYRAAYDGLKRLVGFNDSDLGSCTDTPMPADCSSTTDLAWKYTYDADGNQLSQTDPRNVSTYTTYDALNRPLCSALSAADASSCSGSTNAISFYDSYSNVSTPGAAFPTGCVAPSGSYASDPIGHETAEIFVGASDAGNGWCCYGYDGRGRTDQSTLSVTTPDGHTLTQTVNLTYDDQSDVTSLVYPDGEVLTSNFDANGRFQSAYFGTSSTPAPVQFLVSKTTYTNNGRISSLAMGGSGGQNSTPQALFTLNLGYDSIQRVVSTSATEGSTTLFRQTRTYDNDNNVLGLATSTLSQSGTEVSENEAFCYDAFDRLVWAGNSGTPTGGDHCMSSPSNNGAGTYSQAYSYDSLDRLTNGAPGTYTYGDANHPHAATRVSSVPNQYAAYDAMGNMTCRNTDTTTSHTCAGSSPTGATMSYDNEGRLSSWTAPSGTGAGETYLYDNAGDQVLATSTSQSGVPTDTISFDSYTETVISGSTTTTNKYYGINGQRLAEKVGGTLSYLVSDLLSNVVMAVSNSGTITAVKLYEPYGHVNYSWGSMPTAHNYTGQRLDSQSGLLYYNFRWYDPFAGQFVRTDTKQNNANGFDPYAYVSDNPETKIDPTGHWGWGDIIAAVAIVAVVAVIIVAAPIVITAAAAAAGAAMAGAFTVAAVAGAEAIGTALTVAAVASAGMQIANNAAGGTCSFTPDTVVSTKSGKQAIGTLHAGDQVLAYNPQTHKMELQPVLHVWTHSDNDLIDITLTTQVTEKGGKTHQQKEVLHTTSEHPFLTKEKGFLPAGQLKPGMHVRRADGSYGIVTAWKRVPGTAVMYNLTVQQDHTFVVGVEQWVVHNVCISAQSQAILQRLQSQLTTDRGNQKKYPYRKANGQATNSLSELYDSKGNLISTGMSDERKDDPEGLFGKVQCSEGNCLINGRPLVRGQTYNLYTAQIKGLPACPACEEDIQQAADKYGININVYSIDASGNPADMLAYVPNDASVYPDVNWQEKEEEEFSQFMEDF